MNQKEYKVEKPKSGNADLPDNLGRYDLYACDECGEEIVTSCPNKGHTHISMQCPNCNSAPMQYKLSFECSDSAMRYQSWRRIF